MAWENLFKPEIRYAGQKYFDEGAVSISQPSDTEVQAYFKAFQPTKVILKSPSVSSSLIKASCTCSAGKKGQFCKHLWATLLKVGVSHPAFLDGKVELEISEFTESAASKRPISESQAIAKEALKARQADYRQQQYQKQKAKAKEYKSKAKSQTKETPEVSLPSEINQALCFFLKYRLPIEVPFTEEVIRSAKKRLAMVLHPDVGGSHKDISELNRFSDILLNFIKKP